jgi:predicted Rossmann-fold nucleotide-binding protein
MTSILPFVHHDLVTPDGAITHINCLDPTHLEVTVTINDISPNFLGFHVEKVFFNLKSTIAQLGVTTTDTEIDRSLTLRSATIKVRLEAVDEIGTSFLGLLEPGIYLGKLFAFDDQRRVRNPEYLSRMFNRIDREGKPLLCFGNIYGKEGLGLKKIEGRTIAFLPLLEGTYFYDDSIKGFLPVLTKALKRPDINTRKLLRLLQHKEPAGIKKVKHGQLLIVNTLPLHIRTVYARVVDEFLPKGMHHTSASILQPDTTASGDVYELYGSSDEPLEYIPLEFYTLDPYREHVFFSDRDQLLSCIEKPEMLFKAMQTSPVPKHHKCATFVVKGTQLLNLKPTDWVQKEAEFQEFPGFFHPTQQVERVEEYMHEQPSYPILEAIEKGEITSQGILLSRYLPSPLMKRMLLSEQVAKCLKGIYFQYPSRSHGEFFSHEDRSMLLDLAKFGIPIFWLDQRTNQLLQYVPKPDKDSGMFVPLSKIKTFINATMFGIYGSNLTEGDFDPLITKLLNGLRELQKELTHPLLNPSTPLAIVTGGSSGIMTVGNRIAKKLGILSCANIIDFVSNPPLFVNEQEQNPYIEAKMTYRLDRLVERQAEFYLDFPIFCIGGIGTDFEFGLEEVRRKTGVRSPTPILLAGNSNYWKEKISSRFQINLKTGTIEGSEWVSNCFYSIQTAEQGLKIYQDFFTGKLPIGPKGPIYKEGFKIPF